MAQEGNETNILETITSQWTDEPDRQLSSDEAILTYRNHKEQRAIAPTDALRASIRSSAVQQPSTYQQVRIDPPPSMYNFENRCNNTKLTPIK
jgi:hypothetical protein